MSTSWHEELERAYAELDESQRAIAQVQHDMAGRHIEVTSKNRMLTVVTDVQGEVTDIKFTSRLYRSMPPAELSALLVETIAEARRQALAELAAMFSAVLPQSTPVMDIFTGTVDMDAMVREAIRGIPDLPGSTAAERS